MVAVADDLSLEMIVCKLISAPKMLASVPKSETGLLKHLEIPSSMYFF